MLFVATSPARGQLVVSGLADKRAYNDSVTFTAFTLEGYDYGARLDGDEVPVNVAIQVTRVD